jgi:hypothetical protein
MLGYCVSFPWRIHGAAIYGNMDPINIPQMLAYIPAPWILWDCCFFKCFFADVDFSLQTTQLWLFASLQSKFYAWLWQPLGVVTGNQQQNRPRCRWMRINHPVSCVAAGNMISKNPRGTLRKAFLYRNPICWGFSSTMCVGTPKQLLLYIYNYYIYYIIYNIYIL